MESQEEATQPCKSPPDTPPDTPNETPPDTPPLPSRFDRLSFRASQYDQDADKEWTATQIVTDPRRLGIPYAGMSREDLADIVCILHPESSVAQRDATLNARHNPKGIISFDVDGSVPIREKDNPDTFDTASQGWEKCDLALRLSADRREPKTNGWVFGRNPKRCDFILGNSASTGSFVSNRHFRIYINTHGTVMLEDLSTNGTALDGDLLRVRHSDNANAYRHTLEHGQVVAIVRMDDRRDDIRFVVRIPQRDYESQDRYDDNVARFHLRQQEGTKNPVRTLADFSMPTDTHRLICFRPFPSRQAAADVESGTAVTSTTESA